MQPFLSTTIKVLPFTNEVLVNGQVFKSAHDLWTYLQHLTLAHAPGKSSVQIGDMAIRPQVFVQDPAIAEFLAVKGVTKCPPAFVLAKKEAEKKNAVTLEELGL